jgi:hypothetical protein
VIVSEGLNLTRPRARRDLPDLADDDFLNQLALIHVFVPDALPVGRVDIDHRAPEIRGAIHWPAEAVEGCNFFCLTSADEIAIYS